jgi:signal transduction histidine kinase
VPVVLQGKCIGLFSVVSQQRGQYSDEDAALLQEVANQIALAVQNMQSYQKIASLKARLEKENVYLREELRSEHNFEEIVAIVSWVLRFIPRDIPVPKPQSDVNRMGAHICHDLRLPLSAILANAELLTQPDISETERNESYQEIRYSIERMDSLITSLFEYSFATRAGCRGWRHPQYHAGRHHQQRNGKEILAWSRSGRQTGGSGLDKDSSKNDCWCGC